MSKGYFYFVAYSGESKESRCKGNFRVWRDTKIDCEEEFTILNDYICTRGAKASAAGDPTSTITKSNIIITSIQLLN